MVLTQHALIEHIDSHLNTIEGCLPAGVSASVCVREARAQLEELRALIDPTPIPFSEALIEARQAVAPLTPAEFALHINDQTGDLIVPRAFIEAFKVAFLAVVNADEVDWLHVDFYWRDGTLEVQSDPLLASYLDANHWGEQLALELLGLS